MNTSPPTVTGTAQEGQKLVGHRGTWSGRVTDYNDHWVRCDKDGGSCANISGANDRNGYVLKGVDVGNTLRFKVEAMNADGNTFASSVPTAVVTAATKPPPPVTNGCTKTGGTVPVAGITSPARLNIDQTQVSPSTISFSTRSLTARFHISACKGNVEGALVYVTAVPYGMFAIAERAAHRIRRLGDPAVHRARRLPGQPEATAARDVRPRPQVRRRHPRRHLQPPPRLLPVNKG